MDGQTGHTHECLSNDSEIHLPPKPQPTFSQPSKSEISLYSGLPVDNSNNAEITVTLQR